MTFILIAVWKMICETRKRVQGMSGVQTLSLTMTWMTPLRDEACKGEGDLICTWIGYRDEG